MQHKKLDGQGAGNSPALDRLSRDDFQQALSSTAKKAKEQSPFAPYPGSRNSYLVADASNFNWNQLRLDHSRAGLGYPEQRTSSPSQKKQSQSPNSKPGGGLGRLLKGGGLVGGALLLAEGLKQLAGPAPVLETHRALGEDGDLAVSVYGKEYKGDAAEPGTAYFTKGIGGERLNVPVAVTQDGLRFDPDVLEKEYGKPLPSSLRSHEPEGQSDDGDDTGEGGNLKPGFAIETRTQEEADLVGNMRALGKSQAEIQNALSNMREHAGGVEAGGGARFKPAQIENDYTVAVRPTKGGQSLVAVSLKDEPRQGVEPSTLMGTFNSTNGDLYIGFYSTGQSGKHIGREMLSSAIEGIGADKVKSVSASFYMDWTRNQSLVKSHGKTNFSVYQRNIADGMSVEDAIWNTPLGKSMNDLGFNELTVMLASEPTFSFGFK